MEFLIRDKDDALWIKAYFAKEKGRAVKIREAVLHGKIHYVVEAAASKKELQAAVADFIMKKKRNEWICNQLQQAYFFRAKEEQNRILEIVAGMLKGERPELTDMAGGIEERAAIEGAVAPLVGESRTLPLASVLTFRLKGYFDCLDRYIGIAIDEYKMEQEYQIFVQSLRDYLKQKEPKREKIKLCLGEQVKFYNGQFREMTREELDGLIDRRLLSNHPVYIDSVTIAPLLSIAPARIEIYTDTPDHALIRTICNIFEERVAVKSRMHFMHDQLAASE
ncbi:putative sporulation protein YtxC [Heyndrickxia coagulans]|uniref:putative sporulation protein YtxC n=1 Tax=Heyndrickxia coagulans TaxID=1398 RepID=UPI003D20D7BF